MARNQKLTRVVAGRAIAGVDRPAPGQVVVRFGDGSTMTVHTDGTAPAGPTTGAVRAVRQQGTTLQLDLAPAGTLVLHTAEATANVMVRDARHALEYAD